MDRSIDSGNRPSSSRKKAAEFLSAIMALLYLPTYFFRKARKEPFKESVFDQSGGVIVGAAVTVIDVARGVTQALDNGWCRQICGVKPYAWHLHGASGSQRLPNRGA